MSDRGSWKEIDCKHVTPERHKIEERLDKNKRHKNDPYFPDEIFLLEKYFKARNYLTLR